MDLVHDLDGLTVAELESLLSAVEGAIRSRAALDNPPSGLKAPTERGGLFRCGCGRLYQYEAAAPGGGVWYVYLDAHTQDLYESDRCACGDGLPPASRRGRPALF